MAAAAATAGRRQAAAAVLRGKGLLSFDCSQYALKFESEVKGVPKDASCWAHEGLLVLYTVRELDIDRLEEALPLSDPSIRHGWKTLIELLNKWREFREESVDYDTTILFRDSENVALELLDAWNEAKCSEFIIGQPSGGESGDMPAALTRAASAELGLLYDLNNPVHKWAIAMRHPKTQFSDPVMRAILKLDFDGSLGVVTLSRITQK